VFNVGAYSVTAYQQSNIIVKHNIIHDTRQYGVALKSDGTLCNNVQIIDNTFYNCYQVAVKLAGASNSLISGNTITIPEKMPGNEDPEGITLYSLDYRNTGMTITNNKITGHGGSSNGIGSQSSANAVTKITNNQISNVGIGIQALFSNGIITGNTISGSGKCIANSGSGNTVSGNTCT
jgi:parallel beta-helix repeat protein